MAGAIAMPAITAATNGAGACWGGFMRRARPIMVRMLGRVVLTPTAIRLLAREFVEWKRRKHEQESLAPGEHGLNKAWPATESR
jgi:hypothetical protein